MSRTMKNAPTSLNLWVLGDTFCDGLDEVSNQVAATRRPHLVRLLRAGLIEVAGPVLRLTPAGRAALGRTNTTGVHPPTSVDTEEREESVMSKTKTKAKSDTKTERKKKPNSKPSKPETPSHTKAKRFTPTQDQGKAFEEGIAAASLPSKPTRKGAKKAAVVASEPAVDHPTVAAPETASMSASDPAPVLPLAAPAEGATTASADAVTPAEGPAAVTKVSQEPSTMNAAPEATAPVAGDTATTSTSESEEPRMPPVGTVIRKCDRQGAVRCECTVVDGGVSYGGTVYRSLSAAAIAAAKDLGLAAKAMNGWTFWGLTKTARPTADPLGALQRAWEKYQGTLEGLLEKAKAGEHREPVMTTLQRHARVLQNLHDEVA